MMCAAVKHYTNTDEQKIKVKKKTLFSRIFEKKRTISNNGGNGGFDGREHMGMRACLATP